MDSERAFRRLTFGRKLDGKRLQAELSKTMREAVKNPSTAASARVESILIEADETTVVLSGNHAGLEAVTGALRSSLPYVTVSEARRDDAMRPPRAAASPAKAARQSRRKPPG